MAIALAANALLTEVELEAMLQTLLDTDVANSLINVASQQAETICRRKFIKQTYTLQKYSVQENTKYLMLKNYPIVSVTSVTEYDAQNNVLVYTYTENLEYQVYLDEGYLYFYGRVPTGHNNIRITYEAGYVIADVPNDLKGAVAQLCGFYNASRMKAGVGAESIGAYSITYAGSSGANTGGYPIPENIYNILLAYRRDLI